MDVNFHKIFNKVINIVFGVMLIALVIALGIGVIKLFYTIFQLLSSTGITGKYLDLITDVLTLFVLVELSKSLVDYFDTHRLRMTFIVDAAIVFFIRETMILAFQHKLQSADAYSMSALLLVLTILRIGSIFMFQRELKISVTTLEKDPKN